MKSARLAYLNNVSDTVVRTKGDVWNAVCDFRRGTGSKNRAFGRATPALNDKDGCRIETEDAIKLRWIEQFSSIEAGTVVEADYIVDTVMQAEDSKASLQVYGRLEDLPTARRLFNAVRKTKVHSAPGPDAVGPGIYRHHAAIEWSVTQLFALAIKQSLCLRAPIQNRGGSLFALWKRAAITIECSNHRSILCANSDGKCIAKGECEQFADDLSEFLSHSHLFQCGGWKCGARTSLTFLCGQSMLHANAVMCLALESTWILSLRFTRSFVNI